MTSSELVQLVDSSFIADGAKEELRHLLRARGADAAFFKRFNDLLVAEVGSIEKRYTAAVSTFDARASALEEEAGRAKDALTKQLEHQLEGMGDLEFSKRENVWDVYYATLDLLGADLEKKLKKLSATSIVAVT